MFMLLSGAAGGRLWAVEGLLQPVSWNSISRSGGGTVSAVSGCYLGFDDVTGSSSDRNYRAWVAYSVPVFGGRVAVNDSAFAWSLNPVNGSDVWAMKARIFGLYNTSGAPPYPTVNDWHAASATERWNALSGGNSYNQPLWPYDLSGIGGVSGTTQETDRQVCKIVNRLQGKHLIVGIKENPESVDDSILSNDSTRVTFAPNWSGRSGIEFAYALWPDPVGPANGTDYRLGVDRTVVMTWTHTAAGLPRINYRIQVSKDPAFATDVLSTIAPSNSQTFGIGLADESYIGRWHWRVHARNKEFDSTDASGNGDFTSAWSNAGYFDVVEGRRYTVDLVVNPSGAGTISKNPLPGSDGKYLHGTDLTLTANAASGFAFDHWSSSNGATSTENPVTSGVMENVTVTAHFNRICNYAIAPGAASFAPSGGNGTVTVSTSSGCTWSSSESLSWVQITSGANGSGNGTVNYMVFANDTTSPRSGTITVAGKSHTVNQAGVSCNYTVAPTAIDVPANGGNATLQISVGSVVCSWTIENCPPWISLSEPSGNGSRSVTVTVAPNPDCISRSSTLRVAGYNVTVNQAASSGTYAISPTSWSPGSSGGNTTISINTGSSCPWSVSNPCDWITLSRSSGSGSGSLTITCSPNSTCSPRTRTLAVAGKNFIVTQAAGTGTFSIAPSSWSAPAAGGNTAIQVTGTPGCPWPASSNPCPGWLTISPISGTGSGSIVIYATANPDCNSRTCTLVIAGKSFTVTQAGSAGSYTLTPANWSAPGSGGSKTVSVGTGSGCAWSVSNPDPSWVTITPSSGTGSQPLTISVGPNPTCNARTSTPTIAGKTFPITQAGGAGSFNISQVSWQAPATSAAIQVNVSASAGCNWTGSSTSSWAHVSPVSGTGNGSVTVSVDPNPDCEQRICNLWIAEHNLTVTQAAGLGTYSISPSSWSPGSAASTTTVALSTGKGCPWTLTESYDWLSATPTSGIGSTNIMLSVTENTAYTQRVCYVTIKDKTLTVTQDPRPGSLNPGAYYGLFFDANGATFESSGAVSLNVSGTGAYSGTVRNMGAAYSISGKFSALGMATKTVPRIGKMPLTLNMSLNLEPGSGELTGTVSDGSWTSNLEADRLAYNGTSSKPLWLGKYTLVIPGVEDGASPFGHGYAKITVNNYGKIVLSGKLADNTTIASSGWPVSKSGQWPLYIPLYTKKGCILGWMQFTNSEPCIEGQVLWIKKNQPTTRFYPSGFTNLVDTLGCYYIPTESIKAAWERPTIIFEGAGLTTPLTNYFSMLSNTSTLNEGPSKMVLKFMPVSGTFTGQVLAPFGIKGKWLPFRGTLLQEYHTGHGFLLGTNTTGRVLIGSP